MQTTIQNTATYLNAFGGAGWKVLEGNKRLAIGTGLCNDVPNPRIRSRTGHDARQGLRTHRHWRRRTHRDFVSVLVCRSVYVWYVFTANPRVIVFRLWIQANAGRDRVCVCVCVRLR
jgi:hypothetical protein